ADEFSWSTALHRCIAVGLVRLPEPPVPEPEPVVEPEKTILRGRQKDAADRKQYQQELQQELFERIKATPFWGEACQSIADTSHKELGAESQIKLAEIFATGRHGAPSISNTRRAARAYWGDAA